MKTTLAIIGLTALLAAGCASVPMTDTAHDLSAKKFVPDPDKASIYVNRGGGVGTALTLPIVLDGRIVGALAPHTYQLLSVPAGEHVLATAGTTENVAQFKFITDPGKNYFFNATTNAVYLNYNLAEVPTAFDMPGTPYEIKLVNDKVESYGRAGVANPPRQEPVPVIVPTVR